MCQREKTSVEHVPPRCLFPQQKDLDDGDDLRKQLITVPSCDIHNTAKSKDDEYLLYSLLLSIPNNETSENYFFKKGLRAIQHNPSLIENMVKDNLPVTAIDNKTGEVHKTIAVKIDENRLHQSLISIGYALYFHHFSKPWSGEIQAYPHFLIHLTEDDARELNEPNENMQKAIEEMLDLAKSQFHGENPKVFCYQYIQGSEDTPLIMYLRFYEGSRATLMFKK